MNSKENSFKKKNQSQLIDNPNILSNSSHQKLNTEAESNLENQCNDIISG